MSDSAPAIAVDACQPLIDLLRIRLIHGIDSLFTDDMELIPQVRAVVDAIRAPFVSTAAGDCPDRTRWEWGNLAGATGQFVPALSEHIARTWDCAATPLARRCVGPAQLVKDGHGTQT